jgi:hypothetical protein
MFRPDNKTFVFEALGTTDEEGPKYTKSCYSLVAGSGKEKGVLLSGRERRKKNRGACERQVNPDYKKNTNSGT